MRDLPNVCSDCDEVAPGRRRRCDACSRKAETVRKQRARDALRAQGLSSRGAPSERAIRIARERSERLAAIRQARREERMRSELEWRASAQARRLADRQRMEVIRAARARAAEDRRTARPALKSRHERTRDRVQLVVRAVLVGRRERHALLDFLGYDAACLRRHFERQFVGGMTWAALRSGAIHVGHVLPVAGFDLSREAEVRAAWALSNLRPEWALDNWQRGARRDLLI